MKKPKIKKPNIKGAASKSVEKAKNLNLRRRKTTEQKVDEAISNVPRITNETVNEHREDVLSSARKYIYPLQHSKHKIVRISLGIFAAVVLTFLVLTTLSLYKFQSTGGFVYDVTKVLPYPVAKAGSSWVSYESYLFELRRNMHYYTTQQQSDFSTKDGKAQLKLLKAQAMAQVVEDAYVKQLAQQNGVTVSDKQVDEQITLLQNQNRLGNNPRVFRDVLSQYWGWNEADFKRELKQQLLKQAVVTKLDTQANQQASKALVAVKSGQDFGQVAAQYSDDAQTKGTGGQYPNPIASNDRNISPAITAELAKLKPGETSGIINTGYTLEIVKVIEKNGDSVKAAHIQINLKDISAYTAKLQKEKPVHYYIKVEKQPAQPQQ